LRLAQRREPLAVVDELGVAQREALLLVRRLAVERERLERPERLDEQRSARRLVDAARLDADEPVLDQVDPADAVPRRRSAFSVDERAGASGSRSPRPESPASKPIVTFSGSSGASSGRRSA
jgi:hypothetical protein